MIEKLDYLKDLGIDVIWLSPMYKSPNDDNGYDISDYQAIMAEFGTMNDFDQLLEGVHQRGMKLILDLVVNHTLMNIHGLSNQDQVKIILNVTGIFGKIQNLMARNLITGKVFLMVQHGNMMPKQVNIISICLVKQPDLNWNNKDVRKAVFDMMNWWFDKGIDGFRVDAITHIKKTFEAGDLPVPNGKTYAPAFDVDMNQPGIQDWLQEMKDQSLSNYDIMTVGEANGVTPDDADEWVGEKMVNLI